MRRKGRREELELGCCVSKEKGNEDGISTLLATEGRAGLIGVLQNHCAKLQNHSCTLSYCATLTGLPHNSTIPLPSDINIHKMCYSESLKGRNLSGGLIYTS